MDSSIINHYSNYDEDGRLTRDNVHKIEWLTTMHYFNNLIPTNSYILDSCAGTGNYSFELASQGHKVVANDLTPHHVEIMKQKQQQNPILADITEGDVCNLSCYIDETFDVVLCMGAFYHIDALRRAKAMQECLRILKKGGLLVIAYINNMAVATRYIGSSLENMDYILNSYHQKTPDNIFLCTTPQEIEALSTVNKATILKHIAADGPFYFMTDKINAASYENFQKYMQLHLQSCEDATLLGYSLHGLIFLQKQ